MPYKLVLFDFDGTLADSFHLFLEISEKLADRYRFKRLDRANLEATRNLDARQMLRLHQVSVWKLPFIVRDARRLMEQNIARVPLFPGIDTALGHLAGRGVTLAIATSNLKSNVLSVLGPANSAHITHFECGISLFGKGARLRKVLARYRIQPSEALLVGDEIRDATAARRAGIPFGAVTWGYTRAEALLAQRPDELFRGVDDLKRLVPGPASDRFGDAGG